MKNTILTSIFVLFGFGVMLYGQNPCNDGTIIINGDDIDAVLLENNNKQGLKLPFWLSSGTTIAAGNRVKIVSVIEFNEEAQSGGGYSLVYNGVINVETTTQTVPTNKVWKVESIIKFSDPFTVGLTTSSNSPICFDDNLNLTSSVAGAAYAWTGPAGFTSSAQNPTINNVDFTNAGTYYLTATHNGCSYSDSVNVVINPQPASTFSNTYAIENYASTFTPTVSGQNYAWTFASGSPATSNAQNPQITWGTAGSYQVDLTVTDGNGCSSTTQQNVTVSSCFANDPNSDFSWGTATAGYATAFTPDLIGAASYNWSFDNGSPATSTQQNPSITWSSAGTYAVTLTVSTGSACYTTTQNVTVSNCQVGQPESDFSWTSPAAAGNNITFTPDDMGANTYAWTFDQATPNSSANTVPNNVAWTNSGTYDVTLLTTFAGGCFTTTQQVQIVNMLVFTTCGQTGNTGPSQGQCNTEYSGTALDGLVTVTGGIQEWTVPQTGTYRIEVYGAQGGGINGGLGAYIEGTFSVTQGETMRILVGQKGAYVGEFSGGSIALDLGGGGGGTFVHNQTNAVLLLSAAGGGGEGRNGIGTNGQTNTSGTAGNGNSRGTGGSNGGGGGGASAYGGAGGGGFCGDGGNAAEGYNSGGNGSSNCNNGSNGVGTVCATTGGASFLNGGMGGEPSCYTLAPGQGSYGGFGGGGGTINGNACGGGGGGYSGGGGGGYDNSNQSRSGGGGGSYIDPSATNVATSDGNYDGSSTFNGNSITNLNSFNSGHGQVIIYY